jgi:hypothetical protein
VFVVVVVLVVVDGGGDADGALYCSVLFFYRFWVSAFCMN